MLRWASRKMCNISGEIASSVHDITTKKPLGAVKTVKGWIKSVRKLKNFTFIDVSDGSCESHLQVVFPKVLTEQQMHWGASVNITGKLQENKNGQLELYASSMEVIGKCDVANAYPFNPKEKQAYDLYRKHLHLRPQIAYFTSILRVRNAATQRMHQYFLENGFLCIHTPIITGNDCEGAGETFLVQPDSIELLKTMKKEGIPENQAFFDSPAYLTVSGQFHLECMVRSISKVYSFNPCFRAENSRSRLHLSEFYMIESEEAFVTSMKTILDRIEGCLKFVTSHLLDQHSESMEFILKHNETNVRRQMEILETLIKEPFVVMPFKEAKSLIEKNRNKILKSKHKSPNDLSKEEELFLVKNNGDVPVFVIDWPKQGSPFYMKECESNPDLVEKVDLLVPKVGELCGGSLREDDYEKLAGKLELLNSGSSLDWYLELRQFRNVPTGGFGIGFERYLQFILNVPNIKDTIPFPRWPHGLQL